MSKLTPGGALNESTILQGDITQQVSDLKQYFLGRILTLVDGCFTDQEQRKAVKDMVKDIFWTKEYFTESMENSIYRFVEKNCPKILESLIGWERNSYEDYKKRNKTPDNSGCSG